MDNIVIRECISIEEFDSCIRLQREVFGLSDLEISPRRHLIVSRQAGGWTLGAFVPEDNLRSNAAGLVGFVHHLAAVKGNEIFGYSHMMAVAPEYQNQGVGGRLKWSQRKRAIEEGRSFIKWTWDPMQARNAHFNLNRLGVTVTSYAENFYGTDYVTSPELKESGTPGAGSVMPPGMDSDRLFANWQLQSRRVIDLARGSVPGAITNPDAVIDIPADWSKLIEHNLDEAKQEQLRVRQEFQNAFAAGLVCAAFDRSSERPRYLLYKAQALQSF
jgi:predicted GNAT superfamily acetyltransferase